MLTIRNLYSLHGSPSACVTNYSGYTHGLHKAHKPANVERFRIITSKLKAYDFYPNSTYGHAYHAGVTTVVRLDQGHLYPCPEGQKH
jgi:hypothetical protein